MCLKGSNYLRICGGNEERQCYGKLPQSLHLCELTVVVEKGGVGFYTVGDKIRVGIPIKVKTEMR